jgi:carbamoylphosphate synthase small subunit
LKKARVMGIGSLDTEQLVRLAYREGVREGAVDTLRRLRNMPDEEIPELRLV